MRKKFAFLMMASFLLIASSNTISCFGRNKNKEVVTVPNVVEKINASNNLIYSDSKIATREDKSRSLELNNILTKQSLLSEMDLTAKEQTLVYDITNEDGTNYLESGKVETLDFLVKPNPNYPENGPVAQHTKINVTWNESVKTKEELIADIETKIADNPTINLRGMNLNENVNSNITKSLIFLKLHFTKEEQKLISLSGSLATNDDSSEITYIIDGNIKKTNNAIWYTKVEGLNQDSDAIVEINDLIFAALDDGIYRSNDSGNTFAKLIDEPTFNQQIWFLFNCNNSLYMAGADNSVWYLDASKLNDNSSQATNDITKIDAFDDKTVTDIFEDTTNNIYFAAVNDGLWIKKNNSSTYESYDLNGEKNITSIQENNNVVFIGTIKNIYKSNSLTNVSFNTLMSDVSNDDKGIYLISNNYGKIFASTSNGLLINNDNTFESYDNNVSDTRMTYMAYSNNIFYALDIKTNSIYRSSDGGFDFQKEDSFSKRVEHSFVSLNKDNTMLLAFVNTAGLFYYYEYIS